MSFFVWRWLTVVLVFTFLLSLAFYLPREHLSSKAPPPAISWQAPDEELILPTQSRPDTSLPSSWSTNGDLDANNFALSTAQCDAFFPELYHEIDRAVRFWQELNHTITSKDVDLSWRENGLFKILLHDNKLRVLETKGSYGQYQDRVLAVVHQLHRALQGASGAGTIMPTIEFSVTVDDLSLIGGAPDHTHATWTFARRLDDIADEQLWIMPDFNFWAAPIAGGTLKFEETRRLAIEHDSFLIDKIPKVVWRGARWTNEEVRGPLIESTISKSWADVKVIDWEKKENIMPMEDMCDYMFTAHTEGRSWSGRLKYLLGCDSLPIIHELQWTTHYYHLLQNSGPLQNYVPVGRGWEDLEQAIEFYLANPTEAQRVADNSVARFRAKYITPAATACYWRKLIQAYSTVAFIPNPYEVAGNGGDGALRGIAFEEFM
nr:protein o-glucosyltransferase 1 [Quercus suber]